MPIESTAAETVVETTLSRMQLETHDPYVFIVPVSTRRL